MELSGKISSDPADNYYAQALQMIDAASARQRDCQTVKKVMESLQGHYQDAKSSTCENQIAKAVNGIFVDMNDLKRAIKKYSEK